MCGGARGARGYVFTRAIERTLYTLLTLLGARGPATIFTLTHPR